MFGSGIWRGGDPVQTIRVVLGPCTGLTKRAFDEFKIRWIPPVPLVYPQPAGFFFLGCSLTGKKTADPLASMLAD